jgi:hypothetical protein
MVGVQLFQAGLWVNMEFGQRYASAKRRTTLLIKRKDLAMLCVKTGDVIVFLTGFSVLLHSAKDRRNLVQKKGPIWHYLRGAFRREDDFLPLFG